MIVEQNEKIWGPADQEKTNKQTESGQRYEPQKAQEVPHQSICWWTVIFFF